MGAYVTYTFTRLTFGRSAMWRSERKAIACETEGLAARVAEFLKGDCHCSDMRVETSPDFSKIGKIVPFEVFCITYRLINI